MIFLVISKRGFKFEVQQRDVFAPAERNVYSNEHTQNGPRSSRS